MKLLASLTILASLVFMGQAHAESEAQNCISCSTSSTLLRSNVDSDAREIRNTVSRGNIPQMVFDAMNSHPRDSKQFGNTCSKFSDGSSYGEWGATVVEELRSGRTPELMRGAQDLKAICRGYEQMDQEGKEGLWVTVMAAMGFYEASCDEQPPLQQGPNGILSGLMQLDKKIQAETCGHLAQTPREDKLRTQSGSYSIRCAMMMLNDQIGSGAGLFAADPYWQVIKNDGRQQGYLKIQDVIESYALCK
ncbi:MAG: hypothetical protein J7501_12515 [Bdellovibrio sp.]|nr:hypothetical protein [Bdellovibrio sp.]